MTEYLSGSLYVVETAKPTHWINRALKQIDDRLFLERQLSFDNQQVWCVVCDVGLDSPPMTLIEFRDSAGNAIPEPTEQLVQRVACMERDGNRLNKRVFEANERFKAENSRRTHEQMEELRRDMIPRFSETRSVILPRGVGLRRSRDAHRSRGAKI